MMRPAAARLSNTASTARTLSRPASSGGRVTFLSRAVTPTHVVVTAVFDPPCGTDAYANVRACELSVELEDPHWQPTARDRPLLRCIA